MRLVGDVDIPINPLPSEGIFFKGNMEKNYVTIPINISANPNVVENVYIGANCSLEEVSIYTPYLRSSATCLPGHMRRCQA